MSETLDLIELGVATEETKGSGAPQVFDGFDFDFLL